MNGWGSRYIGFRFKSAYRLRDMTVIAILLLLPIHISIHIPLERYDKQLMIIDSNPIPFQSTHRIAMRP